MKWATKLLLTILFGAFFQNVSKATNPEMNALYREMIIELHKQSTQVFYARTVGEPWLPVLTKLEMGRHIYAKIDLLEGILAELEAKRGQILQEEGEEYLIDENAVKMFLDFMKNREGEGHKAEIFSKFPRSKFENKSEFVFIMNDKWVMDELLGKKYPAEFFEILDPILAMKLSPVEIDPETNLPARYRPFQIALFKFIEQLKFEIVVGQTQNDFSDLLKRRIQAGLIDIQQKIDKGPKGILSKALEFEESKQKALFNKYKKLNEAALKLYNLLAPQIPELMDKKAKNEETKLSEEIKQMASEVKKAFGKVLSNKLVSTSSIYIGAHSKITPMLEIRRDLCLPTKWLEDQKKLFTLVSSIQMNTAMLLLGYERAAEFFNL